MKHSIYIHIPFCAAKCPYCSFPVVAGSLHHENNYFDQLELEASRFAGGADDGGVLSVYVGGGTPSLLSEGALVRLGVLIRRIKGIGQDLPRESTFELNPEDVVPAKAALLRRIGFTRMSFGAQSFDGRYLSCLGRRHGAVENYNAFQVLREAGFDNINVDLMFGFPGQTIEELDQDIDAVLSLGSEHLSIYALSVDPRSLFSVRRVKVSDEAQAFGYRHVCARLAAAGFKQYEISNFARPGFESIHNLNYWQGGEYLGLGMGAHGHMDGERYWNADTLPKYLEMMRAQGHAVAGRETLLPGAKMMETFLFGLRMNAGVDMAVLEKQFGVVFAQEKLDELENLIEAGFLVEQDTRICATEKGRLVLDEISARLI